MGFYITTATAFPENPGTRTYFNKICEMPSLNTTGPHPETFWQQGGDCDDRTRVFADYLKSKGATGVQICWVAKLDENGNLIQIEKGDWGHEFLVWNNKVYFPSSVKQIQAYGMSIEEYKSFLKTKYGYNTWFFENSTTGIPF